jgi:3-oxoadipate:acetyl-CoA acetyltransferase
MTSPAIITVAITGSVPQKKDNPAVPVTVAEQVESTHAAFEAGATVVHVHVRNDDGSTSSDPEKFARFQEGVRKHCPGMIVQFSTSGRSGKGSERGGMLRHRPDMASLSTGSVNFASIVYENPPALVNELAAKMIEFNVKPEIEVFDLAMLYAAHQMAKDGRLKRPLHVQFVFGIANALPPLREILEFEVAQLAKLEPDATWAAAGIGRSQLEVNRWCLEMGGHCRTGLEDNIKFDQTRLAASNAELVARLARLCGDYGRHPASVAEARRVLGLPAARTNAR